jgi:hypothetical protein
VVDRIAENAKTKRKTDMARDFFPILEIAERVNFFRARFLHGHPERM